MASPSQPGANPEYQHAKKKKLLQSADSTEDSAGHQLTAIVPHTSDSQDERRKGVYYKDRDGKRNLFPLRLFYLLNDSSYKETICWEDDESFRVKNWQQLATLLDIPKRSIERQLNNYNFHLVENRSGVWKHTKGQFRRNMSEEGVRQVPRGPEQPSLYKENKTFKGIEVSIESPAFGQRVSHETVMTGFVKKATKDTVLRAVVFCYESSRFHPQSGQAVIDKEQWQCVTYVGNRNRGANTNQRYRLLLVLCDDFGDQNLKNYLAKACRDEIFTGLSKLPPGCYTPAGVNWVDVVRDDRSIGGEGSQEMVPAQNTPPQPQPMAADLNSVGAREQGHASAVPSVPPQNTPITVAQFGFIPQSHQSTHSPHHQPIRMPAPAPAPEPDHNSNGQ